LVPTATEWLVAERTTNAYRQVSELLADLRDALAGSRQSNLAEERALMLKPTNPTLRRHGFVPIATIAVTVYRSSTKTLAKVEYLLAFYTFI